MLTLLSECHFWTIREEVRVKSNDFGAFRYVRQRDVQSQDLGTLAKRDYVERRNGINVLKNSRKSSGRLKDNIKKLEELLKSHKVVYSQWKDANQVLLLFANGIIAHICLDIYTGDILRMVFEKYLVGKLASEVITDAFFTRSHIVLAYNTNQLTVVYLQKPNTRPQGPEKISNMDPKIFHVIIPGTAERKIARQLTVNSSFDLFVVWTKSSQNEVYPWRPTIRDQDRANIHVFKLQGMQLESIAYCWSENDPLCIDFLRSSESQILTLEQKISRKGEISAELCSYNIISGKMQRTALTSIAMSTQICCFAFSPDQEKLFLGTIDRNICLHDLVLQTTKFVAQIEIIPTQCSWHCDSAMIVISNEKSQFQCFDLALNPIGSQLQSEDVTPLNLLDLSHYFSAQSALLSITFNTKPDLASFSHTYAQTDCFLLLIYEHGPIGCLRFFSAAGMRGDIHNSGLTADVIVDKYLNLNQLEKAVNMLNALNWETYGAMCLITLHKIANYVFYRCDNKRARIELMVRALKTFTDALSEETKDEFSDQVFDLKRRFFFYLLRKNLFMEAFEIAQDIEDYDLFMDLYNVTKMQENLLEFSKASFSQAAAILHNEDQQSNGNLSLMCDLRTESEMCSQSSDSETQQALQNVLKNYVPPLPSFKSKIFNAEMIKINIPKPELRVNETRVTTTTVQTQSISISNVQKIKITNNDLENGTNSVNENEKTENYGYSQKVIGETKEVNNDNDNLQEAVESQNGISVTTSQDSKELVNGFSKSISEGFNANISQNQKSNETFISSATAVLSSKRSLNVFTASEIKNPKPLDSVDHALPAKTQYFSQNIARGLLPPKPNLSRVPPNVSIATNLPTSISSLSLHGTQTTGTTTLLHHAKPAIITEFHAPLLASQQYPNNMIPHQPKFYQHPLVSGKIPATSNVASQEEFQKRLLQKKPTTSILSNGSNNYNGSALNGTNHSVLTNGTSALNGNNKDSTLGNGKSMTGEKNKVKFSDTIQVAVVPEIPRKDKMLNKRNGYSRPVPRNVTNPKKELADSLPLCHPNDDYLKDFNPLSTSSRQASKSSNKEDKSSSRTPAAPPPSIKVVHFGVV